jgi:predicted transcriptional regulator
VPLLLTLLVLGTLGLVIGAVSQAAVWALEPRQRGLPILLNEWIEEGAAVGDEGIYPLSPGVAKDSETSTLAAQSMKVSASGMRNMILEAIRNSAHGFTCDEVEAGLKLTHQTCSARIRELVLMGDLRKAGEQKVTRQGRKAEVYVATTEDEKEAILAQLADTASEVA